MKKIAFGFVVLLLCSFSSCDLQYHGILTDQLAKLYLALDDSKATIGYYSYAQKQAMDFKVPLTQTEQSILQQSYIEELHHLVDEFQLSPFHPTNQKLEQFFKQGLTIEKYFYSDLAKASNLSNLSLESNRSKVYVLEHAYVSLSVLILYAHKHLSQYNAYDIVLYDEKNQKQIQRIKQKSLDVIDQLIKQPLVEKNSDLLSFYQFQKKWINQIDLKKSSFFCLQ